jgi:hypothetical protein
VFMEPSSPKGKDLLRDPRFALHCGVEDDEGGGGEVLLRGTGRLTMDPEHRGEATAHATYPPEERYVLYILEVTEVLATRYDDSGPIRRRWRSESS